MEVFVKDVLEETLTTQPDYPVSVTLTLPQSDYLLSVTLTLPQSDYPVSVTLILYSYNSVKQDTGRAINVSQMFE